ncbi:permease [Modestobacter sp. NPDC049651]|uniref:permease n=1 Tax=unclassified Modestobacter TaxID=2643866 RepID=UPI0033F68E1F
MSTRDAVRSGGSAARITALSPRNLAPLLEEPPSRPPTRRVAAAGVLLALVVAAAALLWAKWLPYEAKVVTLSGTRTWEGSSVLSVGGVQPGDAPTWHAATSFSATYLQAIWKALVAALLISAAVQAFVPRTWLVRLLNRPGRLRSAAVGGLVSTPSMMCTCCTAPVAATLRRDGVSPAAALAYWLGNPLLNPAVIVFLALVAPWQWTVTRVVVGAAVVVGGSALVARLTSRTEVPLPEVTGREEPAAVDWFATAPARFARTLLRLLVTLVPEYLVVVLAVGAFRGWLFPIGSSTVHAGVVVLVVAAVVGTLLVIPTGGEIPVLQGLALAGVSLGGIGALLLTLPAVSIPGMAMVSRAFGWRTTWATAALVAVGGIVAGVVLLALPA